MPALSRRLLLKLRVSPLSRAPSTYARPCSHYLIAIVLTLAPPHLLPALALPFLSPTHLSAFVSNSLSLPLFVPTSQHVTHGLLVRFCLLCGDRTAYCTDMESCKCGLPFLEPSEWSLVSFRTSDGGLVIR